MAVVSGLGNTRKLMKSLESGQSRYDFVESCKQKSIAEMKKVPQNLHS